MKKIITTVMLVFCLSGCSTTFVYNNIDWWIDWYIDDYVELNKEQEKAFDKALTSLHKWHRETQLTLYVEQLNLFKTQVNRGITMEELAHHRTGMQDHWQRFINKVGPEVAELSRMLTPEQQAALKDNIAKDNQQEIDDYEELSREEWVEERQKAQVEDLKEWVGKLTKSQKTKVYELTTGYQSTFKYWIEYRLTWQKQFFALLDKKQLDEVYAKAFADLLINARENLRSDEYKNVAGENNRVSQTIMHYQFNNMTKKQKKKFNRKIDNLIEDLTDLIDD